MVRLYLPSKATYITLSLAGIRAPSQRGSDGAPEAFFELARYTVESKLLGRDLNVIVEGAAPMGSNKERFYIDRPEGEKLLQTFSFWLHTSFGYLKNHQRNHCLLVH